MAQGGSMSERPGDRVQELFDQAVALPPEQHTAFLEAACANDPALRAVVESLLACDARFPEGAGYEGVLKSPLVRAPEPTNVEADEPLPAAWPPGPSARVGRYRILRRIAEGGMGAVYEAEQDSPRRPVALKIVRPGLASPGLVKRFTHEAQILARLHHPGIAQVYEAGLADDGQPFFAMEFIRGLPLDEYANRHGLDLTARVGLLARVCDAVQHAHDKGVIHRDLKPANILVEGTGQPKVLDFGVARATGADLLTAAGLTQTGQLLGTPSYMSPEQVNADPDAIDQRADVYALGVILFELAAHRLPYRLEDRPLAPAARLILEEDPPRLGSIHRELSGDVETIVARALEKDPARRYSSAADLAADLRRWLAHKPILARPPSALYHLRKFARRHKALAGGVVATGVALVLGLIGTIFFAVGEAWQRGQAEHNAQEALLQAYRAHLSAAVAALQNHDVLDATRQLNAAPKDLRGWEWWHLHSRLDDSSAVIPLPAAGDGYLLAAPDQLRIGAWTSAGLRLTNLEGGELETLPIGPQRGSLDTAAQTCRGLRVVVWAGNTTFNLLDEAGQVLCRVEVPEAKEPCPVVVSPDGKRLACRWSGGARNRIAVFDATSGQRTAVCDNHPGGHPQFDLQSGRHAARLGRRGPDGAPVGPGHRRAARHMSGARGQAPQRRVQRGRRAPRDDLVGRDGAPVGHRDRPGGRSALRPPYGRGHHRRVQPGRPVGRLGGNGPDQPGVAGDGSAGRGAPARPHGGRDRGGVRPGRPPAGLPQ
jgi:predicted Ser/Thr protein kinase